MNENPPITPYLLAGQFVAFTSLALPNRPAGERPGKLRRFLGGRAVVCGGALSGAATLSLGSDLRATPAPAPGAKLRTTGAYRVSRHPIYTGLLIAAGGRALASGGRRHLISTLALAGIFTVKARYEEALLGANYEPYRASTPRWGIGARGGK